MPVLRDILPPVDKAIQLEPQELAILILECLCRFEDQKETGMHNLSCFTNSSTLGRDYYVGEFHPETHRRISRAFSESWMFLLSEGFIAPEPDQSAGWVFVTVRGRRFRESSDYKKFRASAILPNNILDPVLSSKVTPPFMRGDYDSAIFEAFKEVEIRVRSLSGFSNADIGTTLMRKAFHPDSGPLTDNTQLQSEKQAISDLFAGAIGSFKNPSSHRDVDFGDPDEVVKLILFADNLLRIVDRRRQP